MQKFKPGSTYVFRDEDVRNQFMNYLHANKNSRLAEALISKEFLINKINDLGDAISVTAKTTSGKKELSSTLIGDPLRRIIFDHKELCYFKEIETVKNNYSVMTADPNSGQGFFIRLNDATLEEAQEFASSHVKRFDDDYCFIIQKHSKVSLKQEPVIVTENF